MLIRERAGGEAVGALAPLPPLVWLIKSLFYLTVVKQVFKIGNSVHPTIKFTAEISDTEITLLHTRVF